MHCYRRQVIRRFQALHLRKTVVRPRSPQRNLSPLQENTVATLGGLVVQECAYKLGSLLFQGRIATLGSLLQESTVTSRSLFQESTATVGNLYLESIVMLVSCRHKDI